MRITNHDVLCDGTREYFTEYRDVKIYETLDGHLYGQFDCLDIVEDAIQAYWLRRYLQAGLIAALVLAALVGPWVL